MDIPFEINETEVCARVDEARRDVGRMQEIRALLDALETYYGSRERDTRDSLQRLHRKVEENLRGLEAHRLTLIARPHD